MVWSRAEIVTTFDDRFLIRYLNDFSKNNTYNFFF